VAGLGVSDHVCWVYGSDEEVAEFREAALQFAADGMALGQRLVYVADRPEGEILAGLRSLGDVEALRDRGALSVQRLAEAYPGGAPVIDHEAQLAAYDDAVERAIADGFAGIRVVAEISALVADPAWCDHHVRWEMVADRYMATARPFAALCGYDQRVIGAEAASVLAAVHPVRHDGVTAFSLFAAGGGNSQGNGNGNGTVNGAAGTTLCIDGEIDAFQVPILERALTAVPDSDALVLDMADLRFVDTAGTATLAQQMIDRAAGGVDVHVRSARPLFRRMWSLLGYCEESVSFQ
jgi:anti-anti-sigma regulatory factor